MLLLLLGEGLGVDAVHVVAVPPSTSSRDILELEVDLIKLPLVLLGRRYDFLLCVGIDGRGELLLLFVVVVVVDLAVLVMLPVGDGGLGGGGTIDGGGAEAVMIYYLSSQQLVLKSSTVRHVVILV